jgi:hypothetical protein
LALCLVVGFQGCKPEVFTFEDNPIPLYTGIPTVLVSNYVNRAYIDAIGREPTDEEMDAGVFLLEENELHTDARRTLLDSLVNGTSPTMGTTFRGAYFEKVYSDLKARFIEGASDAIISQRRGIFLFAAYNDSLGGDLLGYALNKERAQRLEHVLNIRTELRDTVITLRVATWRLAYNSVYDEINMNSFNFINATFDDYYQRYPTSAEFEAAYPVIESNLAGSLMGQPITDKRSYLSALTDNPEWTEGTVRWAHRTLLSREPSDAEVLEGIEALGNDLDLGNLYITIMTTDEYAGFD